MRLTKLGLIAIKGAKLINRIAEVTGVDRSTVYKWIENNSDNLTKAAVLNVIKEETGLTDKDILEEVSEVSN